MHKNSYQLRLAGMTYSCAFREADTARYFGVFCRPQPSEQPQRGMEILAAEEREMDELAARRPAGRSRACLEYEVLTGKASAQLLRHGACIVHGAAFVWRGKAYLFTAPSGTGKTTQFLLWNRLFSDEIAVINGDKPIIRCHADGTVRVHPSPWMGKEQMGSLRTAPLGGIIYLQQAKENAIRRLPAQEAAVPVYTQLLYPAESTQQLRAAAALEEQMLRAAPVWLLRNKGDAASAALTHDTILQEEGG